MKQIFIIASTFLFIGCSSVSERQPSSTQRTPASESSFEALPYCARIKYIYLSSKVPVKDLPSNFNTQAFIESKQVWTAAAMMERDTNEEKNSCMPLKMNDLIEKPDWCKNPGWSGPYVSKDLAKNYENMSIEDFAAFKDCWNQR